MRVLIVAEPSLFEEGIEELLRQEEGLEVVGREEDPEQAARRIKESSPDVIILIDGEAGTALDVDLLRLAREGFQINMVDVVATVDFIFRGGPGPEPEYLVGDCNCNRVVNLQDAVYLIDYIFKMGDEPCGNP